jgi:hypothetical protein
MAELRIVVLVGLAVVPPVGAGVLDDVVLVVVSAAGPGVMDDVEATVDVGMDGPDGPNTMLPAVLSSPMTVKDGLFPPNPGSSPGRRLNQQRLVELKSNVMGNVAL